MLVRQDPHQIVQLLGPWSDGKGPLYERLAHAFEHVIRTGELPAHTRLPAERWLAQCLGVSRSTVVAAYTRLQEGEWVTSRRGSGTLVCAFSPQRALRMRREQLNSLAHGPVMDAYLSDHLEAIDLSAGAPAWPAGFAAEECALRSDEIAASLAQYGYMPQGLPELRQAIAEYHTRKGLRTRPEHILVTTGAQQAIGLLASLLLQRGDTVILESPTFFGAIDTFRAAGARLAGIPNDASGLDLQRVSDLVAARVAQCVYLIPTYHNPTGNTLTETQRNQLVNMTQANNIPLIEDLTMANNALDGEPPPPMATYAQDGGVVTIGSLSKLFWAGLRVGWIRGSVPLIERLARLKALTDLGSSMISQLIAIRLMAAVERVKELRRQELTPRRDLLLELLGQRVPEWSWRRPKGGLFVWVRLPAGDARELAQEALHRGVIVTPGNTFSVDGSHIAWLRIPYLLPPDRLRTGLERLNTAWEHYSR